MDNEREIKIKHKDTFTFRYRDIYCEIVHWGVNEIDEKGIWNAYICLFKDKVEDFDKLLCKKVNNSICKGHKYWDSYSLEKFFDFHCGITYYEVLRNEFNGKIVGVKIGCDYHHLWDLERDYDENIISRDLKNVVDNFYNNFPKSGIEMLEDLADNPTKLLI